VPTVAIVGYTNAGKSTLLNALTGADAVAEDKLFATLETRSRTLRCGWAGWGEREVVITDTVGFIRNLPKDLFAAFRATFEEAAGSDLLIQVVDASDAAKEDHLRTVTHVLGELELLEIPRLLVFNKIDLIEPSELRALERTYVEAVFVSATRRETTRVLIARIAQVLAEKWEESARGPSITPADE
jgi:GTP-binding protein HflX